MVRGLDTFAAFFTGDEARYVLIGGVATRRSVKSCGRSSAPVGMKCARRVSRGAASTVSPSLPIPRIPRCLNSLRVSRVVCLSPPMRT